MAQTLLQLVQQSCKEMSLPVPNTAIGNTAIDTVQMIALLNALGAELTREFEWQYLVTEYRFTTSFLSTTGTWTTSAATVTGMADTTGLDNTYMVSGTGIPNDTYIVTRDSATQVTLSQTPTAAQTGGTITFGKTKYSMPADYDRMIDRTHFDKSKRWEMLGPESAQQWQWLKSSYISTGPRLRYRILGNTFQIWPMSSTAEYLGFEYLSSYWITATGGTAPSKTSFTVDTDTCIFPDRLMVLGLKLKYFEIKGFDTTAYYRDYIKQLDLAKSHDHGSPTLSFAPRPVGVLVGWENIPDSNYGQ
jgi:hypothetical protein